MARLVFVCLLVVLAVTAGSALGDVSAKYTPQQVREAAAAWREKSHEYVEGDLVGFRRSFASEFLDVIASVLDGYANGDSCYKIIHKGMKLLPALIRVFRGQSKVFE